MEPQLTGVTITAREIYDAVVQLIGRVDVLIEQQSAQREVSKDHEYRIRALERSRWPLHSLAILVAIAGFILSFIRFMG